MKKSRMAGLLLLGTVIPMAGWSANRSADLGEQAAAQYRSKHPDCSTVLQYGKQTRPIGQVTGDPEKDTVAYPVERTQTSCPTNPPSAPSPK
jgi:hypothetical protein